MAQTSDGKWTKTLCWAGKIEVVECKSHSYAWSGRMPCTGELKCILCGKPKGNV